MTDADGVDWPRIEKLVLSSYTKRGAQATFALMYGLKEGKVTDADKLLAMELQARQAQAELLEKRTIADQLRESLLPMQYDSSVIRFKKQFEVDGKQYAYAAIFAGGRWYITGGAGSRSSYDLDQLILFLASGKVPTRYVTNARTQARTPMYSH